MKILLSLALVLCARIALADDLVVTHRFVVSTNTSSPQSLDLGALIRALPQVANKAQGFGGGKIQLGPGTYFTGTNALAVNTPFDLELGGAGMKLTALVITNMNGTTPGMSLVSSANNPLSIRLHDLTICSTTDVTNAIVSITNTSVDKIENVFFAPWAYATNVNGEAGADSPGSLNLIGLNIASVNGQQTILENVAFGGLQVGAAIGTDHLRILGYCGLEICGAAGGGPANSWGTSIYSVGGGVFLNQGMNDDVIEGIHSYATKNPLVRNFCGADKFAQVLVVGGSFAESGVHRSLSACSSGAPMVFIYHNDNLGYVPKDATLQFTGTNWSIIEQSPPNIIDTYQTGYGSAVTEHFAIGGNDLMVLSGSQITFPAKTVASNIQMADGTVTATNFTGNGQGLTNFNLTATTNWSTVFDSALVIGDKAYTNRCGHSLSVQVPVKWHQVPGHKSELVLNVNGARVSHAGFEDDGSLRGRNIFMDGNVAAFVPASAVVSFSGFNLDQFTVDGVPQIIIWP